MTRIPAIGFGVPFWLLMTVATFAPRGGNADDLVSIGGFIPFVGIGLTDQFDSGDGLDATFFIADSENSIVGSPLSGSSGPHYDVALLDTGAATHILTPQADGPDGFDIAGNGFSGTNVQPIGGATGIVNLEINDPLGIFAAGLAERTAAGAALQMDTSAFRGQSSIATLSAPSSWTLPNIIGLPMAAHHAISIRNDQPQIFELNNRTMRTPQVDFIPLGSGDQQNITRRLNLKIKPGPAFVQGPLYVQDVTGILTGNPFHENPLSPTVVENAGLIVDVDMSNAGEEIQDKEFLFDTGADFTVISTFTAARLGIDPILDTPDFELEVEGSGGLQGGIPGFFIEELNFDTIGGDFTLNNVPVAVLDVTNPTDPGNIIDGIIGMHLFNGRNLVIDANPSIGQGGAGPTVYIGDPVTNQRTWDETQLANAWTTTGNWLEAADPDDLSDVLVKTNGLVVPPLGVGIGPLINSEETVFRMTIDGDGATVRIDNAGSLTTFGELLLKDQGELLLNGGQLDAQFINLEGGKLSGNGQVFVGTGPLTGAVRNLSGIVAPTPDFLPPNDSLRIVGTLAIDGDYSSLAEATLEIDLGTLLNTDFTDLVTATRFAFLAGTLDVNLIGTPSGLSIGDQFTILTAEEGVSGQFDTLMLPNQYQWTINYLANSVVLEVTGLGLTGDFNSDGVVDQADYAFLRNNWGAPYGPNDLQDWRDNYGATNSTAAASQAVPEPASILLACLAAIAFRHRRHR